MAFSNEISKIGYDYIELPLSELMLLDEADFQTVANTVRNSDLKCHVCNNFIKKGLKLVGPDAALAPSLTYCKSALSRAEQLGAGIVVLGSPWAKNIPEAFSRETAHDQMLAFCQALGPIAASHNITVVLEHNNKTETNYLNQLWEVNALAEETNHPNIKILVDYYHLCIEDEPIEHVERFAHNIRHIHFAKIEGRRYPVCLDEDCRYQRFIAALHNGGYDGSISMEAFSSDFQTDGRAALKFFKDNFLNITP